MKKNYNYLVSDKTDDNLSKGPMQHRIAGYQLFKVRRNVNANVVLFIVKSFAVAFMKKCRYLYIFVNAKGFEIFSMQNALQSWCWWVMQTCCSSS